jgi:protein-L-isoaspartate(D-aspartate) O-methyltransferase
MAPGRIADGYGGYRIRLVEQLRENGIRDLAVLHAFGEAPRHLFVPEALRRRAYEDVALPIGNGQTISQPTTQARYLEALRFEGTERVLEVGTGSGYQAALLSHVVSRVVTVERIAGLAARARTVLAEIGAHGVQVVHGDGSLGWLPEAPYEAILVAAASPTVPEPLVRQLATGGKLIMPLERSGSQTLCRITWSNSGIVQEELGPVQFVPLLGKHGYPAEPSPSGPHG